MSSMSLRIQATVFAAVTFALTLGTLFWARGPATSRYVADSVPTLLPPPRPAIAVPQVAAISRTETAAPVRHVRPVVRVPAADANTAQGVPERAGSPAADEALEATQYVPAHLVLNGEVPRIKNNSQRTLNVSVIAGNAAIGREVSVDVSVPPANVADLVGNGFSVEAGDSVTLRSAPYRDLVLNPAPRRD